MFYRTDQVWENNGIFIFGSLGGLQMGHEYAGDVFTGGLDGDRADLVGHSPAFAEASHSESGYNGMLMAAKAMSMTGYDVIMNPELRQSSRDAFNATDDLD